jgi:hypothetical protein
MEYFTLFLEELREYIGTSPFVFHAEDPTIDWESVVDHANLWMFNKRITSYTLETRHTVVRLGSLITPVQTVMLVVNF